MNIERLCAKESIRMIKKGPKYWMSVIPMYLEGLRDFRRARLFRAAYYFCRHIDDVLDGDHSISQDPLDYVNAITSAMRTGNPAGAPEIFALYQFALSQLEQIKREGDNPQEDFRMVVEDAMVFDYLRGQERRVLTLNELDHYFDQTFVPVTNIALLIAGSSLRTHDIYETVTTQGHIYSIHDLEEDLDSGIINVPQEILERAKVDLNNVQYEDLIRNPRIRKWMDTEVRIYQSEIKRLKQKVQGIADSGAEKVCRPSIFNTQMFCTLYQKGFYHRVK